MQRFPEGLAVLDGQVEIAAPRSLVTPRSVQPATAGVATAAAQDECDSTRAEGYAAGLRDAIAEQERQRTALVQAAAHQLAEASRLALADRERIVEEVAHDAIALAVAIARDILDRELVLVDNPTSDAVRRALRLAPEGDNFVVTVAPGSVLDVAQLASLTHGSPITLREDPALAAGDCTVEVGACRIEHQVEGALARVSDALERLMPTRRSVPDDDVTTAAGRGRS